MDAFSLLRNIPLFDDLDDDSVASLAKRARIRQFEPNDRIVSKSDDIQAFFILLSGRAKIYRSNTDGKEQILYLVEESQPFCFCTAFTKRPYPVNVDALEPSIVADIPAASMEDLAHKEPLLMLKIMQTLAGRLLEAMNLVESLALHGTQQRIASFLLHSESYSTEQGQPYLLPISHRELAKIVGTTPETLSRTIQSFRRKNLIEASGKDIRILDRGGLETLAVD